MRTKKINCEGGFVMIAVYFLLGALLALLAAYFVVTDIELATTKYSKDSVSGFYAAEAGLNMRAETIRSIFVGYNRPSGTSPNSTNPCEGANQGFGDFACESNSINNRQVVTYVEEDPSNPVILTIPPGEQYQDLNAQEYRYTVRSVAKNVEDKVEAILELRFKSRLVPLFQFVAFYNKDLEILPGPTMNLSGPIHTNGDLYLDTGNTLSILGQVTTAGDMYRGRKNNSACTNKKVQIRDQSANFVELVASCPNRQEVIPADLTPYGGLVEENVDILVVPEPDALDAAPGQIFWDRADLRLQLKLDAGNNPDTNADSPTGVFVYEADQTVDSVATQQLHTCAGSISGRVVGESTSFYNNREANFINMFEVDLIALFNCLHNTNWLGEAKLLSDSSDGGLVFHFSVNGPDSANLPNTYGVRIRNAQQMASTVAGAPAIQGLTVVTDQAAYTHGNYNSTNKIPAAILADAFNALSTNWNLNDAASTNSSTSARPANNTTINAAILAGTDTTGGVEGSGGQGGAYNGGLENYPRFHERWSGKTLTYRGSFVSLNNSRHQDGAWKYGNPQYTAPNRNWDYDTDFNDAANLPPLTPRFVYLRQELFVREFEQ